MTFARTALIPAFLLTALLWSIALVTETDPVLGVGIAHTVLSDAAIVATAIFAVMLAATLILSLAASLTGTAATGFQRVIVYALLTFAAPPNARGGVIGLNQSASALGSVLGPLIAGFLFDAVGPNAPMIAAAGIMFVTVAIGLNLYRFPLRQAK